MKLISLTQGLFTQVDDWNYDRLMEHKWYANKAGDAYYAQRKIRDNNNGKWVTICMHRVIMNTPDNLVVDHIDHDGLNNLEENMRNCTSSQNNMNTISSGQSAYLGVDYHKGKYIRAAIRFGGKKIHLGLFPTEELAALAYDVAAKKYHGEFANLNFG